MNNEFEEKVLPQIESFKNNKDGWLERIDNCISKLKDKDDPACKKFKKQINNLQSKLDYKEYSSFLYNYSEEWISKEVRLFELITDKDVDGFRAYLNDEYVEEVGYDMHNYLYVADEELDKETDKESEIKVNLRKILKEVREKHREDYKRMSEESLNGKSEKEIKDYRKRQENFLNESRNVPLFESQVEFGRSYRKEMDRYYR